MMWIQGCKETASQGTPLGMWCYTLCTYGSHGNNADGRWEGHDIYVDNNNAQMWKIASCL